MIMCYTNLEEKFQGKKKPISTGTLNAGDLHLQSLVKKQLQK